MRAEEKEGCVICMEDFEDGDSAANEKQVIDLPCKHLLHAKCLTQWMEKNVICPICDLQFMNKEIMENHIVAVHDRKATYQVIYKEKNSSNFIQPPLKIKCNFCDRTFKSDIFLRHHLAFKHSEAQIK